jgi:DNA-directed RNA polymerase sigma subunit (sigma70/sigma32)
MPSPDPIDPVLTALDELLTVLHETTERNRTLVHRADAIRRFRERGHRYSEIIPIEERPLIVELLTQSLKELSDASSNFRRVEARALYSEGLTMAEIADLFGVTRQRIAALLRPSIEVSSIAFVLTFISALAAT